MKKYSIYVVVFGIGLLLGGVFFSNSTPNQMVHEHPETLSENQMWTCSMHPQILQADPGNCPICGMDLIPSENGGETLDANAFKLSESAIALANVKTSVVGTGEIDDAAVKLSGKIVENEKTNVVQASYFSGRIEQLYINSVGEEVKKGQLLARVYSPELFSAQQELITASSRKESQPELYKAVRNKLMLWKISEAQINQIETSGNVEENLPIYATFSGTVSEKLVDQGDYVKAGQALLKITNLDSVWALFDLYENQLDSFKEGDKITVSTIANPTKRINSVVNFIDPTLNSATRTVKLRAVLDNKNREFKTGMFVEGVIQKTLSNASQLITIPSSAVLWTGARSVVYLKENPDEPIFSMKEITLGQKFGTQYQVLEGLNSGDEIVTNGTFTVDASAQLQGKKSMMNKEGGKAMSAHEGHTMDQRTANVDLDVKIQGSFTQLIDAYLELKDALISSNTALAADKSKAFSTVLEKLSEDQKAQIKSHWASLYETSKLIKKEVSLNQQRKQFQSISEKMITMVKQMDELEPVLFVQYCPMADNNKGASWISKEEQILNPYFGEKMLKCGRIEEIIQ